MSPPKPRVLVLAAGAAAALAVAVVLMALPGVGVLAAAVGGGLAAAAAVLSTEFSAIAAAVPALVIGWLIFGIGGVVPVAANVVGPAVLAAFAMRRGWSWHRTAGFGSLPGLVLAGMLLVFHSEVAPVVEAAIKEGAESGVGWYAILGSSTDTEAIRRAVENLAHWSARLMPAAEAVGALALGAAVAAAAGYVLGRYGRPRMVFPPLESWRTPVWFAATTAAVLVARKFVSADPGALALENAIAATGAFTAAVGTAVFIVVVRRLIVSKLARGLMYVAAVLGGIWSLAVLAVIGLLDPWLRLRARVRPAAL